MYKLVAIDLDGTMLNSEKRISEENKRIVKQAIDKGIKVIACSGRVYAGVRMFARELGLREPLIACNGAIIRDPDTGEVLFSNNLRLGDCLEVIDICHEQKIYFHAYVEDTMYVEKLESAALFYYNKNKEIRAEDRIDIQVVDDVGKKLAESKRPATKIVVVSQDFGLLSGTRKMVEAIENVEVMSSNRDNFEVVNRGVNKGIALKLLSEKMGIKKEDIIALGDNENDYSMLKFAGLGIAMGNAEDFIKEIAGYITLSNDDDGVAEAIKKFVL